MSERAHTEQSNSGVINGHWTNTGKVTAVCCDCAWSCLLSQDIAVAAAKRHVLEKGHEVNLIRRQMRSTLPGGESLMSQTASERSRIEREIAIDYVLERLDGLQGDVADLIDSLDPPHQPPRAWRSPDGGESALEAIATAIFAAKRAWSQ